MKTFLPYDVLKKGLEPLLFLSLMLLIIPGRVAGSNGADDLFSGFDEVPETIVFETEESGTNIFSGYVKAAAAYNTDHDAPLPGQTDWRGLSKLRGELLLEAKHRLTAWKFFASTKGFYDLAYEINDRANYTDQVLDDYEIETELRELWIQGSLLSSLDLKVGRQIVVRGRSDNFRVNDMLNPLDNREPGLVDIEDLRLPLTMSKLDYYLGNWNLGLVAVHEHRYDKTPVFGHDFYPFPLPTSPESKPSHTLDNTELALELTGTFSGWDLSFYSASFFNDQTNFVPSMQVSTEHRRLKLIGAATSIARGNFIFINELAHIKSLGFLNDFYSDYARTDFLFGIEYSGFDNTVISCDYLYRKLHSFNNSLSASPESPVENDEQLAFRISRDFVHDTVSLSGLALVVGDQAQRGALERITLSWNIADSWNLTGGAVFYESGETLATSFGDNDRLFLEIRYDF